MRSLASVLPEFLKQIVHDEDLCLVFLAELWPQLVGAQMARRARPVALRQGKLTLQAESEAWRRELTPLSGAIADSVNQRWQSKLVEKIELELRPMD